MSFGREYAHRPPIPTAEEILEDFNATKTKDLIDPVFDLSEKFPCINKREEKNNDKDVPPSTKREQDKQRKEINDTYNKVSDFLRHNKNLKQSIASMNKLSEELHSKKENLTQLISNINYTNMQGK